MKNFSQYIFESSQKLDIPENSIGYIGTAELKKYLEIADSFLSKESKYIINWMINNEDWMNKIENDENENVLAGFYEKGTPKDESLKALWGYLNKLKSKHYDVKTGGGIFEVPVFWPSNLFKEVLEKKLYPEYVIYEFFKIKNYISDIKNLEGKDKKELNRIESKILYQYIPLIHKKANNIATKYNLFGKAEGSTTMDDIVLSVMGDTENNGTPKGALGAIRKYNGKTNFMQWISNQAEQGGGDLMKKHTRKDNQTVSGNEVIGHDKDGNNDRTRFDTVKSSEDAASLKYSQEEVEYAYKAVLDAMFKKFGKEKTEMFCHSLGIFGYEKMKNTEISKKYGIKPSNLSQIIGTGKTSKIMNALRMAVSNPKWGGAKGELDNIKVDKDLGALLIRLNNTVNEMLHDKDELLHENIIYVNNVKNEKNMEEV